jgi:hypothetical protein
MNQPAGQTVETFTWDDFLALAVEWQTMRLPAIRVDLFANFLTDTDRKEHAFSSIGV